MSDFDSFELERKDMPSDVRIRTMFSKIREVNNNKIAELKNAIVGDSELRTKVERELVELQRQNAMNEFFGVVAVNHLRLAKVVEVT